MSSPEGLPIGKKNKIGKLIGEGAFGRVHAVGNNNTTWACKLTEIPKRKTKKQDTQIEISYQRLYSEYLLYNGHVRHLCGKLIPNLPSSSKDNMGFYYDDLQGYRCLIMERMDSTLFDILPKFVSSVKTKTITLGPIACKLLDICKEFHAINHILLDVKPENIMVARNYKINDIAESIRLVDLGLVTTLGDPLHCGHRPNLGTNQIQGTPLYASLNNHKLETPSRRDDIESMLYVIGDLVRHVYAFAHNNEPQPLPWFNESSEVKLGKVKETEVKDRKSNYYKEMPKKCADILYECTSIIHKCKYSAKPDYDSFYKLLQSLDIVKSGRAAVKKTATKTGQRTSRRTRKSDEVELSDTESPPIKTRKRGSSAAPIELDSDSDVIMEDMDENVDEEDSIDEMECDDEKPAAVTTKSKKFYGVKIVLKNVTGEFETIHLTNDSMSSIVIGSAPNGLDTLQIENANLEKEHVRLTLNEKLNGVQVDPIGASQVKLSRKKVNKSGTMVFTGQTIAMGNIEAKFHRLSKKEHLAQRENGANHPGTPLQPKTSSVAKAVANKNAAAKKTKKSPKQKTATEDTSSLKAIVQIDSGPHSGQYIMEEGSADTLTVGCAPTGKGRHLKLDDAKGVASNHVRLNLVTKNGFAQVMVTDLKSENDTFLNGKRMISGKTGMAFCGSAKIRVGDTTMKIVRG